VVLKLSDDVLVRTYASSSEETVVEIEKVDNISQTPVVGKVKTPLDTDIALPMFPPLSFVNLVHAVISALVVQFVFKYHWSVFIPIALSC
jgi:hypothetical protein